MTLNQVQQAQPHPSPFPGFTLPRKPLPTLSAVSASIALNYVLFLELFSQGLPADFLLCDLHTCPHPYPISAFLSLFLPNIYVLMFRPTEYSLICINTIMYVDIIHRCRTCLVVVEINVLFLICFVFSVSSPSSSPTSTRSVNSSQFFLLVAFPWEPCIFLDCSLSGPTMYLSQSLLPCHSGAFLHFSPLWEFLCPGSHAIFPELSESENRHKFVRLCMSENTCILVSH